MQIDLGDIEPVKTVLENLLQRIGIARCEPVALANVQHPRDLVAECVPLRLGLEGRGQLPRPLMLQNTRNPVCEAIGVVRLQRSFIAGREDVVARARPKPVAHLGFAADLIDGFRIAYLDDGRIGRAEPTGEMGRHVRIARS